MSFSEEKGGFSDPLGVNESPMENLDQVIVESDFELGPRKRDDDEDDIDKYFLQNQMSSMANLVLDDGFEDDTRDLFVSVDNPEKHVTAMESYITFRVNTKTSRPEFDGSEFSQRRRFNDFVWLRERLEATHPSLLIPPLPEKHSLKRLDRFSQEFVHTRMSQLERFLRRLADHPVLSFNKHFHTFLTVKQHEFQSAKKEGAGLFSRVASSFHNRSASYMMKSRSPEFEQMNTYVQTLGEKLGVLERISQRILKEQQEYLVELNEWSPVFTLWSNNEEKLSKALSAVAKAISRNFSALQKLTDNTEAELSNPLREYILYTECIREVLRRRDAIQVEYEITLEELKRKKAEKDDLGTAAEHLQDKSTIADSDLKADMERWHKTKKRDFKRILMAMCDRNIKYYEEVLTAWEEAIPHIQKTDAAEKRDTVSENNFTGSSHGTVDS